MKNKIKYLPIGILTTTTALSGVALSSAGVAADQLSSSKPASVTVGTACTFTGSTSYTENIDLYAGTLVESNTARAPYEVKCNDPNGFKIQAIGFSPDSTHPGGLEGNTAMYNSATGATIATGTSGTNSYWSFKIGFAYASEGTATIATGYNSYKNVPSSALDLITYSGSTSSFVSGLFRPDYQVFAAMFQGAGSYAGAVKYTLVPGTT